MIVLALETSCDETAAAILCEERGLLASEVASQIAIHQTYGGVVPEVASRQHLTQLRPVIEAALAHAGLRMEEIDAVAATAGPGLATSLMIGLSAAKGLALGLHKPFFAINHLEGHLLSPFFRSSELSAIGLVVSGGHTLLVDVEGFGCYRLLGQTRDDAAGEAFDKVGKLLGLPYPGGPVIDKLARTGDPRRFDFPRSMLDSGDFAFSFSGLKTAVLLKVREIGSPDAQQSADIARGFQDAIIEVLVKKAMRAVRDSGLRQLVVAGGVGANRELRRRLDAEAHKARVSVFYPKLEFCTDNGAMIALAGALRFASGVSIKPAGAFAVRPRWPLAEALS